MGRVVPQEPRGGKVAMEEDGSLPLSLLWSFCKGVSRLGNSSLYGTLESPSSDLSPFQEQDAFSTNVDAQKVCIFDICKLPADTNVYLTKNSH